MVLVNRRLEMAHLALVCLFFSVTIALCSARCGTLFGNTVSNADKKIIVEKHNSLRTLIAQGKVPGQPKGVNLRALRWDNKLATEAQKIANTCEFKHVRVQDGRFAVGQNLAWGGTSNKVSGADWAGSIQRWFNEHKNFKYPNTSRGVTGHYTQVVWANTYLIGCGYSWYRNNIWYEKLYVCNYGPAGNYVGQAPYKT